MVAGMHGADVEALDQLASNLESAADEMNHLLLKGAGAVSLLALEATLPAVWVGTRASQFSALWQARHLTKLNGIEELLRAAALDVRKNSTEQLEVSSNLDGAGPAAANAGPGASDESGGIDGLDEIGALLTSLGIGRKAWELFIAANRDLDTSTLKSIGKFLGSHPALISVLKQADKVIGAADILFNVISDMSQQISAGLPMDEVLVHMVAEVATLFAVQEGIGAAVDWAITAVGTALSGGLLAPVAKGVGWIAGNVVGAIADEIAKALELGENAGDLVTAAYRSAKESGIVGAVVDFVEDPVGAVVDAVEEVGEFVGDVAGGAADMAGDAIEAVGDGARAIGKFLF